MIKKLYHLLEKPQLIKYGYLVQKLILLNIVVNILSFSLVYFLEKGSTFIGLVDTINSITVILFVVELGLRYIAIGENSTYQGIRGRIKFTFTFYTLVDIISILPFLLLFINFNTSFLRVIRLIRLVRILKLFRLKKTIKKLVNVHAFAALNLKTQSFLLISVSALLIYLFSYGYGSMHDSALVFLDPPQIAELHTNFHIAIGIIELIIGLFIGGALISIITSALNQIVHSINSGYFNYKESKHIVIINENSKLDFIFEEINKYYLDEQEEQNIVILLEPSLVQEFKKNLSVYTNLEITIIAGNSLQWNSYERVSINKADKIILLLSEEKKINENKKITKFITSHKNFINKELSFVIETEQLAYSHEIYDYIFQYLPNHYTLVNNNDLISKILNRSVVNYDYFKIYSELLSFEGNEFYIVDYLDIFNTPINFKEASLQLSNSVLIGIVKEDKVILNPTYDTKIQKDDKLILIMEDRLTYTLHEKPIIMQNSIIPSKPKLKEKRNIVIVGNHTDIDKNDITQFLVDESIENFQIFIQEDEDYMNQTLWTNLMNSDVDVIILNLEDEYEFTLSLYLNSIYRNETKFLSKIVNILHNPTIANLLSGDKYAHSMILSQKLIGEFISQSLFNPYTYDIFDEITQSKGSELYILHTQEYEELYKLEYATLKSSLLHNNMIYIGAFIDDEFYFASEDIIKAQKIVVLAEGDN